MRREINFQLAFSPVLEINKDEMKIYDGVDLECLLTSGMAMIWKVVTESGEKYSEMYLDVVLYECKERRWSSAKLKLPIFLVFCNNLVLFALLGWFLLVNS